MRRIFADRMRELLFTGLVAASPPQVNPWPMTRCRCTNFVSAIRKWCTKVTRRSHLHHGRGGHATKTSRHRRLARERLGGLRLPHYLLEPPPAGSLDLPCNRTTAAFSSLKILCATCDRSSSRTDCRRVG